MDDSDSESSDISDGGLGAPLDSLWEDCETGKLSLEFVREQIASLPKVSDEKFAATVQCYSLLHKVCANELVSLEIVEEILKFHPGAAGVSEDEYDDTPTGFDVVGSSYPLHAACWNGKETVLELQRKYYAHLSHNLSAIQENCPLSVIALLVSKYPAASSCIESFGNALRWNNILCG